MAAEDTSSSGATTTDYIYGPASTLASINTPGGTYYAIEDWLGSLTGLINSTGTQVTSTTYSPYGTPSTTDLAAGAPSPSIGYASSYILPGGSGLDDMRARDYNPATSEFETVDPDVMSTGIPYAYAGDDPVAEIDLSGLCSDWNLFCSVIQPHWRGIAQAGVDVVAAVGTGFCIEVTAGACAAATPFISSAVSVIDNAIAGSGGDQTLSGYEYAATEGFLIGGFGLACGGACAVIAPTAAGIVGAGTDYAQTSQCPSLGGLVESVLLGAVASYPYSIDKWFYQPQHAMP
jgi:RHS repeat-associated protein